MKKLIFLAVVCFATFSLIQAQSTAHDRAATIEKGFSLAGWLEAGWLGVNYPDPIAYTPEYLELFAQLGFKTVRVPVLYEWIIDENPPYNSIMDSDPFDLINSVIIPAADACDMTVILDNHHGKTLTDANFMAEMPRICGQWKFLTQYYADLPYDRYFFELRNEPTYEISNENLRIVQQAIIDTIRAYDTERTLIVGANWWNAAWSLVQTMPYNDDNIIYTFHSYDPFEFTHQGMTWQYPYIPTGITFSANDPEAIAFQNSLIEVKNWSLTHNVPIFWGEFGVSWSADAQSRCNYIEFTTSLADSLEIPWLYWDIKNSYDAFGIFDGTLHQDNVIPCFANAMGLDYQESCGLLPVELTHFTGSENDYCSAKLTWSTATEFGTDRFEIQKSIDGISYKTIGTVPANGNSTESINYEFFDNEVQRENYYRLKIVERDDSYEFSDMIAVKSFCDFKDLHISPNPVTDKTVVGYQLQKAETVRITIIDQLGRTCFTLLDNELQASGNHILPLNTDDLPPGIYVLQITTATEQVSRKLVKP